MDIRQNAATLINQDPDQLLLYIQGVQALKQRTRPGSNVDIYDEFVAIHRGVASLPFTADWLQSNGGDPTLVAGLATGPGAGVDGAHRRPVFLPWHRAYLHRLEIEMKDALQDDQVHIPYWDWTDQAGTQALFVDQFLGPDGNGSFIPSGHFSPANWPVRPDLQYTIQGNQVITLGTGLVRNFQPTNQLPDPQEVNDALQIQEYDAFRTFLEGEGQRLHDFIHGWVGGSMAMMTSPNDPIFFMHHAFIDAIWAQWQDNRRKEWEQAPGNQGQEYSYSTHYTVPNNTPYGHNLEDSMWPWDLGRSQPAIFIPGSNPYLILQGLFLTADISVRTYRPQKNGFYIRPSIVTPISTNMLAGAISLNVIRSL